MDDLLKKVQQDYDAWVAQNPITTDGNLQSKVNTEYAAWAAGNTAAPVSVSTGKSKQTAVKQNTGLDISGRIADMAKSRGISQEKLQSRASKILSGMQKGRRETAQALSASLPQSVTTEDQSTEDQSDLYIGGTNQIPSLGQYTAQITKSPKWTDEYIQEQQKAQGDYFRNMDRKARQERLKDSYQESQGVGFDAFLTGMANPLIQKVNNFAQAAGGWTPTAASDFDERAGDLVRQMGMDSPEVLAAIQHMDEGAVSDQDALLIYGLYNALDKQYYEQGESVDVDLMNRVYKWLVDNDPDYFMKDFATQSAAQAEGYVETNPFASKLGNFAEQAGEYYLINRLGDALGITDMLASGLGKLPVIGGLFSNIGFSESIPILGQVLPKGVIGQQLGDLLWNQAGDFAIQDFPRYLADLNNGVSAEEAGQNLLEGMAENAKWNVLMNGLGLLGKSGIQGIKESLGDLRNTRQMLSEMPRLAADDSVVDSVAKITNTAQDAMKAVSDDVPVRQVVEDVAKQTTDSLQDNSDLLKSSETLLDTRTDLEKQIDQELDELFNRRAPRTQSEWDSLLMDADEVVNSHPDSQYVIDSFSKRFSDIADQQKQYAQFIDQDAIDQITATRGQYLRDIQKAEAAMNNDPDFLKQTAALKDKIEEYEYIALHGEDGLHRAKLDVDKELRKVNNALEKADQSKILYQRQYNSGLIEYYANEAAKRNPVRDYADWDEFMKQVEEEGSPFDDSWDNLAKPANTSFDPLEEARLNYRNAKHNLELSDEDLINSWNRRPYAQTQYTYIKQQAEREAGRSLTDAEVLAPYRQEWQRTVDMVDNAKKGIMPEESGIAALRQNDGTKVLRATPEEMGDIRQRQFDVIKKSNPAPDDYHTWIRDADDIKTFDEVWRDNPDINPDFTDEMAQEAMRTGKITVYSSQDIENGAFVTPSYMEAVSYAGSPDNVKSAVVNLDDVAWIDSDQGQLAKIAAGTTDNVSRLDDYLTQDDIASYLESGGRSNKNRLNAYENGKKLIAESEDDLRKFMYGDNSGFADTIAYKKVSDDLADRIYEVSNGEIDTHGYFFEMDKSHAGHPKKHLIPQEAGDLPLTEDELIKALDSANNATVVDAVTYPNGGRKITLALDMGDGHVITIETASKSSGGLRFTSGWKVDNDKFFNRYNKSSSNTAREILHPSNQALDDTALVDNSLPQLSDSVNPSAKNAEELMDQSIPSVRGTETNDEFFDRVFGDSTLRSADATDSGFQADLDALETMRNGGVEPLPELGKTSNIPTDPQKKVSEYYNNTLRNRDDLTRPEFADINKQLYEYMPEQEKELARKAGELVDTDIDGLYDKYAEIAKNTTIDSNDYTAQDVFNLTAGKNHYRDQARALREAGDTAGAEAAWNKYITLDQERYKAAHKAGSTLWATGASSSSADGALSNGNRIMFENVDKFKANNPKAAKGIDELASKLAAIMEEKGAYDIMSGADDGAKYALRVDLNNAIDDLLRNSDPETQKALKGLSQEAINKLMMQTQERDIARTLDFWASSGGIGIKDDTAEKVLDLFDEASKYNFDSKEYVNLEKEAYGLIANDLANGKSFRDKLNQWRYTSMLANPTTHLRNNLGNINMNAMSGAKNNLAAMMESAADRVNKARGLDGIQGGRTKSVLNPFVADKALVEASAKDFDSNAYRQYIQQGRYFDVGSGIENEIKTWSDDKALGKALNAVSEFNNKMLENEDIVFGRAKYQTSLAGFLKANGADESIFQATDSASKELLEQARTYALKQANEATFHQNGALANYFTKRFNGTIGNIVLPFKKTPANVLQTTFEYSPLEFGYLATQLKKWKRGAVSTADMIDGLAKGLTGTGMLVGGGLLAHEGIIKVDEGKASVQVGNRKFSLSDLAPTSAPLIYGALIQKTMTENRDGDGNAALEGLISGAAAMTDAVTDMTMLSGISDVLQSVRYSDSDSDVWRDLGITVAMNAGGQMIPSVFGKTARVTDDTKRSTYTEKTGALGKIDQTLKYWSTRIPGLQQVGEAAQNSKIPLVQSFGGAVAREPAIDKWGNEIASEDLGLGTPGRLVQNYLNPFTVTDATMTPRDEEMQRVSDAVGDEKVLHTIPTSEAKINGEKLSPKDWTSYQKDRGQQSAALFDAFMNSDGYEGLSDIDKAEVYKNLDSFSKAYTQAKYGDKSLSSTQEKWAQAYQEGGAEAVIDMVVGKTAQEQSGYAANSKEGSAIMEAAESGDMEKVEDLKQGFERFEEAGLHGYDYEHFQNAQQRIPSLTEDDYIRAYNIADQDGNRSLKQDEIIHLMNTDKQNAEQWRDVFWSNSKWTKVPVLQDDGEWKAVKVK